MRGNSLNYWAFRLRESRRRRESSVGPSVPFTGPLLVRDPSGWCPFVAPVDVSGVGHSVENCTPHWRFADRTSSSQCDPSFPLDLILPDFGNSREVVNGARA
jgi:hypothetical protein